jgi:hypothetical protein
LTNRFLPHDSKIKPSLSSRRSSYIIKQFKASTAGHGSLDLPQVAAAAGTRRGSNNRVDKKCWEGTENISDSSRDSKLFPKKW